MTFEHEPESGYVSLWTGALWVAEREDSEEYTDAE